MKHSVPKVADVGRKLLFGIPYQYTTSGPSKSNLMQKGVHPVVPCCLGSLASEANSTPSYLVGSTGFKALPPPPPKLSTDRDFWPQPPNP